MIPPRYLTLLVVALPLLILAFAVLMGGYALASLADDQDGAATMWRVAMACVLLGVMDILTLVIALGVNQIKRLNDEDMSRRTDDRL